MATSFLSSGITGLNFLMFQANMKGQLCKAWGGLHASPRTTPSKRAKLCTYFAWFLHPSQLQTVPYFEISLPISRLQLLMQFRMGSHTLPVGLLDQPSPGISAAALCARPGHWGMKGILFLTAPRLPTFAANSVRCIRMLMVPCSPCATRTKRLSAIA